jgi:hypothetical protein
MSSGTLFVLVCAILAVGFVLFLIFASPLLLERTQRLAPPPAPQVVATGELAGRVWTVEARDATADLEGGDGAVAEVIVEPEPCARVDLGDGATVRELCVERRGGSFRALEAVVDPSGRAIIFGIVAPQVTEVELVAADGAPLTLTPVYVDFGFPLGFVAIEVDAGASYPTAVARDREGVDRARAVCEADPAPLGECTFVDGA